MQKLEAVTLVYTEKRYSLSAMIKDGSSSCLMPMLLRFSPEALNCPAWVDGGMPESLSILKVPMLLYTVQGATVESSKPGLLIRLVGPDAAVVVVVGSTSTVEVATEVVMVDESDNVSYSVVAVVSYAKAVDDSVSLVSVVLDGATEMAIEEEGLHGDANVMWQSAKS